MSKKTLVISTLATAVMLSGCSDPKAANNDNFAKALDEYLATESAICVRIPSSRIDLVEGSPDKSEGKIAISTQENSKDTLSQLAFLEKYGFLTKEEKTVETRGWGKNVQTNAWIYTITENAKSHLKKGKHSSERLCSGKVVLDKIENFSEPADAFGAKISRVQYTVKHQDLADWAKDPELKNVFKGWDISEMELAQKGELILMNDGWKSTRMVKKF